MSSTTVRAEPTEIDKARVGDTYDRMRERSRIDEGVRRRWRQITEHILRTKARYVVRTMRVQGESRSNRSLEYERTFR